METFIRHQDPKEALQIGATIKAKLLLEEGIIYEMPIYLWKKIEKFNILSIKIADIMAKEGITEECKEYYEEVKKLSKEIQEFGHPKYFKEWLRCGWKLISKIK